MEPRALRTKKAGALKKYSLFSMASFKGLFPKGTLSQYRIAYKAMQIYNGQKARCENKNSARYYSYGAKGITVEYSRNEFIKWYVKNLPRKKASWAVGRINHEHEYCFKNIRFETISDNVKERNSRHGNPGKSARKVQAIDFRTGKILASFKTMDAAAKKYRINRKTVWNHCHGRTKQFFKFGTSRHYLMFFRYTLNE